MSNSETQIHIDYLKGQLASSKDSLNDLLREYYQRETGSTKTSVNDLEREFLQQKTGVDNAPLQDLWSTYLVQQGYTEGVLRDRKRNFLSRVTALLLRDDFPTAESAPLTSPRTAEPGPGTLTITDTENKLTISGGNLVAAGGKASPAYGDPGLWGAALTRRAGLATVSRLNNTDLSFAVIIGFDNNQLTRAEVAAIWPRSTTVWNIMVGATAVEAGGTIATGTVYTLVTILRSAGAFNFVKGGIYSNYTLLWVDNAVTTTPLYPAVTNYGNQFTLDTFRVLDLPSPYTDDYGLATQRLAGARTAGDTFTHTADCVIEWTQTTLPSASSTIVQFRKQDAQNFWRLLIDSTGQIILQEVVGNTPTGRGSAAGVIANGDRIVVVADGSTIRVYEANTLRITYASATNFATSTAGELNALGTGGAVSDIVAWPRTLTGTAATLLDQAIS